MIMADDRWTCPRCGRTTSVHGTRPDVACAVDAMALVRDGHVCDHAAESVTLTWTCPKCTRDATAIGPRADVNVALGAVRRHHDCGHAIAETMLGPLTPTTRPMRAIRAIRRTA